MLFHQSGNISIMIAPELLERLNQVPELVDFGQKMLPFVRMPDVTLPHEERTIVYTLDAEKVVGRSSCIPRPAKVRMTDECKFACELHPPNGLPPKVFPVVTEQVGMETSLITIILVPTAKPTTYRVAALYYGPHAPMFPWDSRLKDDHLHRGMSWEFWLANALVYDPSYMGPTFQDNWFDVHARTFTAPAHV